MRGIPIWEIFLWEREDEVVEDLNAVQFCLFQLIPLMINYGDVLSVDMQDRVRQSIRLGLEEVRRIDVHFHYTNIVVKDITNTCLGGELLGDEVFKSRGVSEVSGVDGFYDPKWLCVRV